MRQKTTQAEIVVTPIIIN